jgi:hypothetical protein
MSAKLKPETFTSIESYQNLPKPDTASINELLEPLNADLLNEKLRNQVGGPKLQYFCKFANEIVLKVFLYYLAGGEDLRVPIPPLDEQAEDDTIELIIEKLKHFKEYYQKNKSSFVTIDEASLEKEIVGLGENYLFLRDVKEKNLKEQVIESANKSRSKSKLALVILRNGNGGNIFLAILRRTPPKE